MTLNELKEPFENILKNNTEELDIYTCNQIVTLLLSSSSSYEKNLYTSYLLCKAWHLLQKIYYCNNNADLSCEECYDIFIQTFHYVIQNHVWDNVESSLYMDKDAFIKAMAVTIQCRKKNFIEAKFKHKRVLNNNIISLDNLYEDYGEGYFTSVEEAEYDFDEDLIKNRISFYFKNRCYLTSFILEGILYNNVFTNFNTLDLRKLRKYLRNIDENFCRYFASKYDLKYNEVKNSLLTFDVNNQSLFDKKIHNSFITLKHDVIIKQALNL